LVRSRAGDRQRPRLEHASCRTAPSAGHRGSAPISRSVSWRISSRPASSPAGRNWHRRDMRLWNRSRRLLVHGRGELNTWNFGSSSASSASGPRGHQNHHGLPCPLHPRHAAVHRLVVAPRVRRECRDRPTAWRPPRRSQAFEASRLPRPSSGVHPIGSPPTPAAGAGPHCFMNRRLPQALRSSLLHALVPPLGGGVSAILNEFRGNRNILAEFLAVAYPPI